MKRFLFKKALLIIVLFAAGGFPTGGSLKYNYFKIDKP